MMPHEELTTELRIVKDTFKSIISAGYFCHLAVKASV